MGEYELEISVEKSFLDEIFSELLSQVEEDILSCYDIERSRYPEDNPEDCADAAILDGLGNVTNFNYGVFAERSAKLMSDNQVYDICSGLFENFFYHNLKNYLEDTFCTPEYRQWLIQNDPERLNNRKPTKVNKNVKNAKNCKSKPRTAKKQVRKR